MKETSILSSHVYCIFVFLGSCTSSTNNNARYTEELVTIEYSTPKKDSLACKICLYDSLSFDYNYEVSYYRFFDDKESNDSCWALIRVLSKEDLSQSDSLMVRIHYGYYEFPDCRDNRSYITDFNNDSEVMDNHFGEFVVADFNFDTNEDFAIVQEAGGNGGPLYCYFIGECQGRFELDTFLTDSMSYFPSEILTSQRKLVTYVHSGAYGLGNDTYQYNRRSKTWRQTQSRLIDFRDSINLVQD